MKKIILVCFGKLRFPGFLESCAEYEKRIQRFSNFKVIELKPIQDSEKEAAVMMEYFETAGFKREVQNPVFWAMDEEGLAMKTTEWAESLRTIQDRQSGELVVVIGGSMGLGQAVLKRANKKICLGPQTASHELARVVLLEQLYRALSLLAGHPYHNEG